MARSGVVRTYGGISAEDRRAERRTRLIATARRAWGDSGLAAVTVRGVCKGAGLTDRYFYEHFVNREALLAATADDVRDQLLTTLVQGGLAASGPAVDRLRAALKACLDTVANDPHIHRILTSDSSAVPELQQRRREMLSALAELVVQYTPGTPHAQPDAERLSHAALFVTGGVSQLVAGWLAGAIEMTTAQLAAECAHMCIAVLAHQIGKRAP